MADLLLVFTQATAIMACAYLPIVELVVRWSERSSG